MTLPINVETMAGVYLKTGNQCIAVIQLLNEKKDRFQFKFEDTDLDVSDKYSNSLMYNKLSKCHQASMLFKNVIKNNII